MTDAYASPVFGVVSAQPVSPRQLCATVVAAYPCRNNVSATAPLGHRGPRSSVGG
jgi:hypothetical protein